MFATATALLTDSSWLSHNNSLPHPGLILALSSKALHTRSYTQPGRTARWLEHTVPISERNSKEHHKACNSTLLLLI